MQTKIENQLSEMNQILRALLERSEVQGAMIVGLEKRMEENHSHLQGQIDGLSIRMVNFEEKVQAEMESIKQVMVTKDDLESVKQTMVTKDDLESVKQTMVTKDDLKDTVQAAVQDAMKGMFEKGPLREIVGVVREMSEDWNTVVGMVLEHDHDVYELRQSEEFTMHKVYQHEEMLHEIRLSQKQLWKRSKQQNRLIHRLSK